MITIQNIAKAAHEANRGYCAAIGDPVPAPWEQASDAQRASILLGVRMHLRNPAASPSESHESWLAVKAAEGWTHGPVKDEVLKQHPCFLPYDQLPEKQRAKDHIFKAVVNALADEAVIGEDRLVLQFDVTYALNEETLDDMELNLEREAQRMVGEGLLTGATSAEVEEHSIAILHGESV